MVVSYNPASLLRAFLGYTNLVPVELLRPFQFPRLAARIWSWQPFQASFEERVPVCERKSSIEGQLSVPFSESVGRGPRHLKRRLVEKREWCSAKLSVTVPLRESRERPGLIEERSRSRESRSRFARISWAISRSIRLRRSYRLRKTVPLSCSRAARSRPTLSCNRVSTGMHFTCSP